MEPSPVRRCPGCSNSLLTQAKMQECLNRLGVNLSVHWNPDKSEPVQGEIKGNLLFLYDTEEEDAWSTLIHEIIEYKLQNVTRPYRLMINSLIESLEKSVYAEKEQFIDFLPKMITVIKEGQRMGKKKLGVKF